MPGRTAGVRRTVWPRGPGGRRRVLIAAAALALGMGLGREAAAHSDAPPESGPGGGEAAPVLAPGWEPLAFPAPEPGSYALPALGDAADGSLLDASGSPVGLHEAMGDGIAVLSFVYTRCDDVNGCPLAMAVLQGLRDELARLAGATDRVRLITVSFDPTHDTPEVLARFSHAYRDPRLEWRFLTAASDAVLAPLLDAYGQSVVRDVDAAGNRLGTFSHVLRVFLVDARQRIRNVYTVSYLHAQTLKADVQTLMLEADRGRGSAPGGEAVVAARAEFGPGDDKQGYDRRDYRTRSRRLDTRPLRPADLLAIVRDPPLGLPPVSVPADNPLSAEKVALGRKLFFDRRLSLNGTISCAMCHVPDQGFTVNEMATAVGMEGRSVRRNAPTLLNVAYARSLFHDAREDRLEQQVWIPLLNRDEMANPSIGHVLRMLRSLSDYQGLFEAAFDGRPAGMETVGMALASYQRTLLAGNSHFDRFRYAGEAGALGPAARRGLELFTGNAGCAGCHPLGERSALFTDQQLHNTGIGYARSMAPAALPRRLQLAPGVFVDVDASVTAPADPVSFNDLGRYEVTQDPADRWKFRTPGLRNVALTAPYMHDGSLPTLEAVVRFYNDGGVPHAQLDPRIRPLGLDERSIADLVAFLESLTGGNVGELVADAFAAPIGDPAR